MAANPRKAIAVIHIAGARAERGQAFGEFAKMMYPVHKDVKGRVTPNHFFAWVAVVPIQLRVGQRGDERTES